MRFVKAYSWVALAWVSATGAQSLAGFDQPSAWQPFAFAKIEAKTTYSVLHDPQQGAVLHAVANKSASAMRQIFEAPAEKLSTLRWSWKIGSLPVGGSSKHKDTDDYAARVYVAFKYDPSKVDVLTRLQFAIVRALYGQYPPVAALTYIVDRELPVGTIVDNPYTWRVKMIVVDDASVLGQWRQFERNIVQDYQRAFGGPPTTPVAGIVVMTDADNTQSRAEAWYGPLSLSVKR